METIRGLDSDGQKGIQYWKSLEQNYQNPTVAPMFDLYKKFSTKHVNPQKNMSQQTAEIQHLMQSMADLAIITPGLLEALGILRFLNTESSWSTELKDPKLQSLQLPESSVKQIFRTDSSQKDDVWNVRSLATMNQTVGSNTPKNALRNILRMTAEMYHCKLVSSTQLKNLKSIKVNRKTARVMID